MIFVDILTTVEIFIQTIGIKNLLDIALVALFIYILLIFIKQTHSFFIFNSIVVLSGIVYIAGLFNLELTRQLFQPFLTFFLLILVIVFQREIRRFFEWFSISGSRFAMQSRISISDTTTKNIIDAIDILVHTKTGAIIVLTGQHPLEHSISGGYELDGKVSSPIIISIFNTKTPGHDGAVIITNNKISHYGAHLPLAQSFKNLDKTGTRHRAAVGITEIADALAIVVSEERGTVSLALNGRLKRVLKEECEEKISTFIREQAEQPHYNAKKIIRDMLIKNWIEKLSSIIIAILLWMTLVF